MNRFFGILIAGLLFGLVSCQTPTTKTTGVDKRAPAQAADEFGTSGSLENPALFEEYANPQSGASPKNSKGRPFFDFEGKYGIKTFPEKFATEADDFADQQKRIHMIQVLNLKINGKKVYDAGDVRRLNQASVNWNNLTEVWAALNPGKNPKIDQATFMKALLRGFHGKAHGCLKAGFEVYDKDTFRQKLTEHAAHYRINYGDLDDAAIENLYRQAHQGLFANPTKYQAIVRYSNGVGEDQPDHDPDVRGLAFKIFADKNGNALPEDPVTLTRTQDFLMTNKTNPFGDNSRQFINFSFATQEGKKFFDFKGALEGQGLLNPGTVLGFAQRDPRLRESAATLLGRSDHGVTGRGIAGVGPLGVKNLTCESMRDAEGKIKPKYRFVTSLATETYWSGSPYRWGPLAVKFQVKPAAENHQVADKGDRKNYLREELKNRIESLRHDVRYVFFVQVQTVPKCPPMRLTACGTLAEDRKCTPIEDALEVWGEDISPPIPVGELVVYRAQQENGVEVGNAGFLDIETDKDGNLLRDAKGLDRIGPKMQMCQRLAFNPWHHYVGHKPMSNLNRGRRAVYNASTEFRLNIGHGQQPAEPSPDDIRAKFGEFPRAN
ncbi:MAG: hypothetical protein ABL958_04145 [Bdellovibrionia bacterium]